MKIGKYEVCGLLGKGGMARVYKVRLPVVGKILALKRLFPHPNLVALLGEKEVKRRFVTEAVTMAGLRHPHLVDIWDFHDADGLTFFVMEYYCNNLATIIGETYRVEEPSRILTVDRAIDYTRQLLVGLARLHQAGIVHRDIKPFNTLITDENQVKITDFGLSKLRGDVFEGPDNLMVGSPFYAAPEQEKDPNQVDARADLFPVGLMLYRMLTGRLPEDGPKTVEEANPDLDASWDAFLEKSAAQDPNDRFQSAREMLVALKGLETAWEKKKEQVCQWQPAPLSTKQTETAGPRKRRANGIKVGQDRAREAFDLDERWRPRLFVDHPFQGHGDGTVTDMATGLVWQQSGSDYPVNWAEANDWVKELNRSRFAGRTSWRLPTVDELMTLVTAVPKAGDLCTAPVFDQRQRWLWSCDRRSFVAAWYVSVELGYVSWQDFTCYYYVRAVS